jgi:IS5 family transposase
MHTFNDRVVELASQAKVIKGRKLQMSGTCVQTSIHHPTDSGLLVDSVRVLSRFVERARPLVEGTLTKAAELCRSRVRSARQVAAIRSIGLCEEQRLRNSSKHSKQNNSECSISN